MLWRRKMEKSRLEKSFETSVSGKKRKKTQKEDEEGYAGGLH